MNSQLVETRVIHRQDLFHKAKALFSQLLDSLLQARLQDSHVKRNVRGLGREKALSLFFFNRPVFC